jgi:hypothetical protein
MRSRWKALILAMMVGTAAGCYQSPDIHYYEPGEYKGSPDPLLEKLHAQSLQKQLLERFQGQTDR